MKNLPDLWTVIEQELFWILRLIDAQIAAQAQAAGCPYCGSVLHRADYPRKPRGVEALPAQCERRYSFCCAECRRRTTPGSVCFLGRKVYWGALVVVVCVLRAQGEKLERVAGRLRVNLSTLRRWVRWWGDTVIRSGWWKAAKAHFMPPIEEGSFISRLYDRFQARAASVRTALTNLLRFVSPLTIPAAYPA